MKIKSLFIAALYSAVTVFALSNCSSKKDETVQEETHDDSMHATSEEAPAQASPAQFQVDATFQQQLSGVFTSYVSLKDAFVATNSAQVKEAATRERPTPR